MKEEDRKVAWFEAEQWQKEYIDTDFDIDFFSRPLHEVENLGEYDVVSVFVDSEVTREALEKGLKDSSVRYAALDVVEGGEFERFSSMENVTFTPHNAFNTEEANERIVDITLENLRGERESLDLESEL